MKIALILIGIIIGYVGKDLLTKESEIVYHIKKLRAKKGGTVNVEAEANMEEHFKKERLTKEERKVKRVLRKNK